MYHLAHSPSSHPNDPPPGCTVGQDASSASLALDDGSGSLTATHAVEDASSYSALDDKPVQNTLLGLLAVLVMVCCSGFAGRHIHTYIYI